MITVRTAGHDFELCDCTRCRVGRIELRERRQEADRRLHAFSVIVERRSGLERRAS
jgi:hypothetical protein